MAHRPYPVKRAKACKKAYTKKRGKKGRYFVLSEAQISGLVEKQREATKGN